MLCGSPPFYGKTTEEILISIKRGFYTLAHKPFIACSVEVSHRKFIIFNKVKDLLSKLLVK